MIVHAMQLVLYMMEDNNESSRRNFVRQLEKYTLAEKQKLGECVDMFKKEYDAEVECLKGKTRYDAKCKKFTLQDIGNLCYTFTAK